MQGNIPDWNKLAGVDTAADKLKQSANDNKEQRIIALRMMSDLDKLSRTNKFLFAIYLAAVLKVEREKKS